MKVDGIQIAADIRRARLRRAIGFNGTHKNGSGFTGVVHCTCPGNYWPAPTIGVISVAKKPASDELACRVRCGEASK